jgi:hypothetical protein
MGAVLFFSGWIKGLTDRINIGRNPLPVDSHRLMEAEW